MPGEAVQPSLVPPPDHLGYRHASAPRLPPAAKLLSGPAFPSLSCTAAPAGPAEPSPSASKAASAPPFVSRSPTTAGPGWPRPPIPAAAAGLTSSARSRPNGASPPAPSAAPSGLGSPGLAPSTAAARSGRPACPEGAPNTRIWTAHVLAGRQPSATQNGSSASVLPELSLTQ